MYRYVEARFGDEERFGGIAASAFAPTGDLPPFLMAQLLFPYLAGEQFVARLLEVGGGDWTVVDTAFGVPPAGVDRADHAPAGLPRGRAARAGLGPRPGGRAGGGVARDPRRDARRVAHRSGCSRVRAGPAPRTRPPAGAATATRCSATATSARSSRAGRWDSPRDADEFAAALRAWGAEGLPGAEPAGADAWRTPDGAAVVARRGDVLTLALAPSAALARRAARAD